MGKKKKKKERRRKKRPGGSSFFLQPKVRPDDPKYTLLIFQIEVGIYEMSVADEALKDRSVLVALRKVIERVWEGMEQEPIKKVTIGESIAPYLHHRITEFLEEHPDYSTDEVIGTIKALMRSVKTQHEMHGGGPRAYLSYLDGFMKQAGVKVRRYSPDELGSASLY